MKKKFLGRVLTMLLVASMVFTLLPAPAIAAGDVCRIPLRQYIPERSVCLIEDSSRPQSVAMRALKDLLCADAGGQAPLE